VTESALLFGEDKSLVAVLTDPEPGVEGRGLGAIILNAGVLHRVGPNRVHVQIARLLAKSGLTALRFDFSGIGDSRQATGNEPFAQRAVREASQAMDVLGKVRGVREFVVIGICAGADAGLEVCSRDPRVVGAILIDGYNQPSLRMILHFYRSSLVNPRSWFRFLAGRSLTTLSLVRSLITKPVSAQPAAANLESLLPSRAEFVAQIRSLADKGTELLLVYTKSTPAYYNYRRLLRRRMNSWPSKGRITVEHLAHSDHVFTLASNRAKLIGIVTGWAARRNRTTPA
jgi:pimeloyl-ACP methyl ester carboxylesterase